MVVECVYTETTEFSTMDSDLCYIRAKKATDKSRTSLQEGTLKYPHFFFFASPFLAFTILRIPISYSQDGIVLAVAAKA